MITEIECANVRLFLGQKHYNPLTSSYPELSLSKYFKLLHYFFMEVSNGCQENY